jgi:hypothetical protein
MPNAPDDPPSSPTRQAQARPTPARSDPSRPTPSRPVQAHPAPARPNDAPAGHLVCAYSPRWLSGPTPAFEGLVATWSPSDGHHDEDAERH